MIVNWYLGYVIIELEFFWLGIVYLVDDRREFLLGYWLFFGYVYLFGVVSLFIGSNGWYCGIESVF